VDYEGRRRAAMFVIWVAISAGALALAELVYLLVSLVS
jgi:hypothetical protein